MNYPTEKYILKVFNSSSNIISKHELIAEKGLHKINRNIIWNIKFNFFGDVINSYDHYFLSDALNEIRKVIEPKGFRILVKCSDYDASHSGGQADITAGTLIYKLNETDNQGHFIDYHIFEESDTNSVVTLEEQNKYRKEYFFKLRNKKNGL